MLRRCPAWKGFAILGEENSMIIRFLPFAGSSWSFKPRNLLVPNVLFCVMIEGISISASLSTLKKNCRKVPVVVGLWTRGDSGNYLKTIDQQLAGKWWDRHYTFSHHSAASSFGFFPLTRRAGTGRTKSPLSSVWVHWRAGYMIEGSTPVTSVRIEVRCAL